MDFWSEGLGNRDLVMGLDKANHDIEDEAVVLTGVVDAPADWAYKVTMEVADWTTILKTATTPEASEYLSNSVGIWKIIVLGFWMTKFILFLAFFRFLKVIWFFGNNEQKSQTLQSEGANP